MRRFGICPSRYAYAFTERQRYIHILPYFYQLAEAWLSPFMSMSWHLLPSLSSKSFPALEVQLVLQPFVALSGLSCFYSWLPLNSCNPSFPTGPPLLSAFLMPSFVNEFVLLNSTQLSFSAAGPKFVVQWRGPRGMFTHNCDGVRLCVTDGWLSRRVCWMNERTKDGVL